MTRTRADVAWIAGIFEGEGSFEIAKNGGVRTTIRMTDRDVLERVERVFPSGRDLQAVDPGHGYKRQYAWRIGPEMTREFIGLVLPWLGERRTAKARDVLAHLDTRPGTGGHFRARTHCPRGHEYTPANTYVPPGTAHRACRACRDRWAREYRERKRRAQNDA